MSRLSNIFVTPRNQLVQKGIFSNSIIGGVESVDLFTDGLLNEYIKEQRTKPKVCKAVDFTDAVASEIIFLTLKNERK